MYWRDEKVSLTLAIILLGELIKQVWPCRPLYRPEPLMSLRNKYLHIPTGSRDLLLRLFFRMRRFNTGKPGRSADRVFTEEAILTK